MTNIKTVLPLAILAASMALPAQAQKLSKADKETVALSQEWQTRDDIVSVGEDGKVTFLFGVSQPSIVCSPLRLCDIELEAGEQVMNVHAGDNVRWKFKGARSGINGRIPHILIKPVQSKLETSLIITTDRRSYHISLKSASSDYMARVGFDYSSDPNNVMRDLAKNRIATPEHIEPEIAGVGSVNNLDFEYVISGTSIWRPVRVYNDGFKTYIDMPKTLPQTEAPTLLIIGSKKDEQLVNYRIKGKRYEIDQLFKKAILIAGAGSKQQKIQIKYTGKLFDIDEAAYTQSATLEEDKEVILSTTELAGGIE